jgi:hypothetical protein
MYPLSSLPRQTLLLEYAYHTGPSPVRHLTQFLNYMGYVAVTSKAPAGRPITHHDTRRLLKEWLRDLPAYPLHRPLTPEDYRRLKDQIVSLYDQVEEPV